MTKPIKSAELAQRIADETASIEVCRTRRGEALAAGRQAEADEWSREIAQRRAAVEGLEDAVRAAGEAQADVDRAAADREAAAQRKQFMAVARECRKLVEAEDAALDGVVAARRATREGLALLWETATGPQRTGELEGLVTGINNLPMIATERLAHGDVVPSRSPMLDRSAPPRSVAEEMEKILGLIAPGPGRPPKAADEPKQEAA